MSKPKKPHCSYCNRKAILVSGQAIYPHRQDLWGKPFWRCVACAAWVGCHQGTNIPLGRLANAELRAAKSAAHAEFDPLWKEGWMTRKEAYHKLSCELGIPMSDCHIGMFDVEQCRKVIEVSRSLIDK